MKIESVPNARYKAKIARPTITCEMDGAGKPALLELCARGYKLTPDATASVQSQVCVTQTIHEGVCAALSSEWVVAFHPICRPPCRFPPKRRGVPTWRVVHFGVGGFARPHPMPAGSCLAMLYKAFLHRLPAPNYRHHYLRPPSRLARACRRKNHGLVAMEEEYAGKQRRRGEQLQLVCNDLPALRVRAAPESLPFFLRSDIHKLWHSYESLAAVLFNLSSKQIEVVWNETLLFVTFLAYLEPPPEFYSDFSIMLFSDGSQTPCFRDSEMPYPRDRLTKLGLTAAKSARWEEQHCFIPATIIFDSPEQWIQHIPNSLTPLPFVGCDQIEEHGGYGDIQVRDTRHFH